MTRSLPCDVGMTQSQIGAPEANALALVKSPEVREVDSLAAPVGAFALEPADDKDHAPSFVRNLEEGGEMIHEVGTARMGAAPSNSVVNPFGQSWEVSNLFVADGAIFPLSPDKNPHFQFWLWLAHKRISRRAGPEKKDMSREKTQGRKVDQERHRLDRRGRRGDRGRYDGARARSRRPGCRRPFVVRRGTGPPLCPGAARLRQGPGPFQRRRALAPHPDAEISSRSSPVLPT